MREGDFDGALSGRVEGAATYLAAGALGLLPLQRVLGLSYRRAAGENPHTSLSSEDRNNRHFRNREMRWQIF